MEELDIIDVEMIIGELKTDAMKICKTVVYENQLQISSETMMKKICCNDSTEQRRRTRKKKKKNPCRYMK